MISTWAGEFFSSGAQYAKMFALGDHWNSCMPSANNDMFFARMGNGLISVFETPSMKLLDRKSLLAEGTQ